MINKIILIFIFLIFYITISLKLYSQSLPVNQVVLNDYFRRGQLLGEKTENSFLTRPLSFPDSTIGFDYSLILFQSDSSNFYCSKFKLIPISFGIQNETRNPYPEGGKFLQAKGYQYFGSVGFYGSFGPLSIQFQPEFIYGQNKNYDTGLLKDDGIEFVEVFGQGRYYKLLPGQSSIRLNYGAFSLGASTENIWWGPGQYNSLLFSNNTF